MNIIACGPSGANWSGNSPSIGVNDCLKFGKPVDAIVCVNSHFEPEREALIRQHRGIFYSPLAYWSGMPGFRLIQTRKFHRSIQAGVIYHSITSPLIAISLAHVLGHREIVLWGVDFDSHPIVKDNVLRREVEVYLRFIGELEKSGTFVFLGADCGVFAGLIRVR